MLYHLKGDLHWAHPESFLQSQTKGQPQQLKPNLEPQVNVLKVWLLLLRVGILKYCLLILLSENDVVEQTKEKSIGYPITRRKSTRLWLRGTWPRQWGLGLNIYLLFELVRSCKRRTTCIILLEGHPLLMVIQVNLIKGRLVQRRLKKINIQLMILYKSTQRGRILKLCLIIHQR